MNGLPRSGKKRLQISKQNKSSKLFKEHGVYKQLVKDELREVEADIFKIFNKHNVKDAVELDAWFQEGRITEAEGWEDFFSLDGLEHNRKVLQDKKKTADLSISVRESLDQ
jgi:hypothetical protein